jgi:hypothetical protein
MYELILTCITNHNFFALHSRTCFVLHNRTCFVFNYQLLKILHIDFESKFDFFFFKKILVIYI